MSSDAPDYPPAVADRWAALLDDARATAEEYRGDGWEALLVHPGDVTPLTDDPFGLDVLAPGNEFEALRDLVDGTSFEATTVYRTDDGDVRFYVIAVEAPSAERAVVVPAFLQLADEPPLHQRATEAGAMYTHVRPLSGDVRVSFTHEDPGPFF